MIDNNAPNNIKRLARIMAESLSDNDTNYTYIIEPYEDKLEENKAR